WNSEQKIFIVTFHSYTNNTAIKYQREVINFMRKTILWLIVVLVMGVIFLSSHEPVAASRQDSLFITEKVMEFLHSTFPNLYMDGESLHHIIRKSAHFIIYMILGVCTFGVWKHNRKAVFYIMRITMVIYVLYAISDERHQVFILGRAGEVGDVFIDGVGALIGVGIGLAIEWVVRRTGKRDQN